MDEEFYVEEDRPVLYLSLSSGSTPTVGSSKIKTGGECRKAMANEALRFCPPLQKKKN